LRADYEELLLRVRAAGATRAETFDLETIQANLGPDALLLEYLMTDDSVLTFALTDSRLESFVTEIPRNSVIGRIRLTWELLSDPSSDSVQVKPALTGLWDLLLGPVAEAGLVGPNTTLIVVPHEVLNYLPFSALHTGGGYLVETNATRYLPSASMLSTRDARNPSVLNGAEAFAPLPDELPASQQEIRRVNAERYIGRRATEWRLRMALERSEVVHVATHGVMNFHNPLFSYLKLTPGTGVLADNGRLEVHEVLDIPVRASLVFLSGCETGMGRAHTTQFTEGEQHETLAQAFLHAGARDVIATLWTVRDVSASVFANQFYESLERASPDEALALAQRVLLQHERYRHPYYWAAYQITGTN
jgi:CHAT domain-containing protein